VKSDRAAAPGEVVQDDFLIRADKNPNTAGARALFPLADDPGAPLPATTDLCSSGARASTCRAAHPARA
jgi:hypothetical protein